LQIVMSADPNIPSRWTARRKAAFLAAVNAGDVGSKEINCLGISLEELRDWQRDFAACGIDGLHATSVRRRPGTLARKAGSATPWGRAHQ
jgi:Protein of unknown function (DUF1153)